MRLFRKLHQSLQFEISDGVLKKYCGVGGEVTIPNTVTEIGMGAFYEDKSVKSVTIPDSVRRIGPSAFNGCERLESVTIPNSVTRIGQTAFNGCIRLKSIAIPDGVTAIEETTFARCTSLESVTIPKSVGSIGTAAFNFCDSLESVTIPDSVRSIGASAFKGCKNLKSVKLPKDGVEIGFFAFGGCTKLADKNGFIIVRGILYDYVGRGGDVRIPDGVTRIEGGAFDCMQGLRYNADRESVKSVTIPKSVRSIGPVAFEFCSGMKRITIPDNVTEIGREAFHGCEGLADSAGLVIVNRILFDYFGESRDVRIPDGVTRIDASALGRRRDLYWLRIPDSVTDIDGDTLTEQEQLVALVGRDSWARQYCLDNAVDFNDDPAKGRAERSPRPIRDGRHTGAEFKRGDLIEFGTYPVGADGWKEPILWEVLETGQDRLLVISRQALDCRPYNVGGAGADWETSSLRKWLNESFVRWAFDAEEQAMLRTVTVSADRNPDYDRDPGNATQDRVFLLSLEETGRYFRCDRARICLPTEYAEKVGVYADYDSGSCWWGLRTPGCDPDHIASVDFDGGEDTMGSRIDEPLAVRPALWIGLET